MESISTIKFLFSFTAALSLLTTCSAADTISAGQSIGDGNTVVSAGGSFELGFFSPENSINRYVGIWYNDIPTKTVVWVANRQTPLTSDSGAFRLNNEGILEVLNSSDSLIWSSNSSKPANNAVARLLDTGNLVVTNGGDDETYIWQSFDFPGDTFLPGMKLGKDLVTGLEREITSWTSPDNPSVGQYVVWMDTNGYPQIFQRRGSLIESRLGPWIGYRFSGMPSLKPNPIYTFGFVFNSKEVYYKYELVNSSVLSRMILPSDGSFQRVNWIDRTQSWLLYLLPDPDECSRYAICGAYGSCNIDDSPYCECLQGFEPKSPRQWSTSDWSGGCNRKVNLECGNDGFRKYSNLKLPDTRFSWFNESMNLKECEDACLRNCSCTAYSNMDFRGSGGGCFLWFGELLDIREYSNDGQELYIRMAASELDKERSSGTRRRVTVILVPTLLLSTALVCLSLLHKKLKREGKLSEGSGKDSHRQDEDLELPIFELSMLLKATNNFSNEHKLGEGGFGSVYKGTLPSGEEIAVKRLSKNSGQGLREFMNEINLVSKLQHRNLVRIVGCCVEGDERMVVYEYLNNKSLDRFIFHRDQEELLTWQHHFAIAIGVAKGILYLHHDSRLRIIHRDLKASNVLLDSELNPKISDFGIARIFGGDQTEGTTRRVVGTYGYMSPEYAASGKFSEKSDVFSFGVLLIEMVSGKKNTKFHHPDHHHNLLGHAWLLWEDGKATELVDTCLKASSNESQVLRFIHVGLLCIQKLPRDRPSMSTVITMLSDEDAVLPHPKQPGFFVERSSSRVGDDPAGYVSENEVTITIPEGR